jgi:uncharacterized protein YcbK (DUF882 family)
MRLVVFLLCLPSVVHADHEAHIAEVLDDSVDAALAADKKAAWLASKVTRTDVHADSAPPTATHPLSLRNMWTDEILPVQPDASSASIEQAFDRLTRCHFTQQSTSMAAALLPLVRRTAAHFGNTVIEIVSGYRAPKYQLMLRKKGHEVARDSAHPRGEAVDFRLPSVPTKQLLAFVRKQRLGGVGYYPVSAFVHADVGRVRFWRGH